MSISVRDARVSEADRLWIEETYRDYLDDLAPLNTGIFPILGEVGHRGSDQVARWFDDPAAHPLVISQAAQTVGFALVVRIAPRGDLAISSMPAYRAGRAAAGASGARPQEASYRMAEFFVSRPNRGRGVGSGAARLILDRFAGRWEIVEYLRNPDAVRFWRRVVSTYTQGRFEERVVNGEVRQVFESARKPGA